MVEWTPTYRDGMSTYCRCVSHTHTLSPVTSRLTLFLFLFVQISQSKRHLDKQSVMRFWETLDRYIY